MFPIRAITEARNPVLADAQIPFTPAAIPANAMEWVSS